MFTRLADAAVEIGEGARGYLDAAAIIEAAKRCGAEALHPGYGFLSENADFADAVEGAGIAFVGPSGAAMRAMGLKSAAKALMIKAGAPVAPGYHGDNQAPKFLKEKAYEIGYPVLIKAIAGGGGRGMRRVDAHVDFEAALESAQREAKAAFGDPRVLIEKYIVAPRHIEVQVFGDKQGDVVHLFERDCSLQRRHQKVIEEKPGARPARSDAPSDVRRRSEGGQDRRLRRRRHRRVHRRFVARAGPRLFLFPRDEHAIAGRAPGHRGDPEPRSRRVAAARRRRRAAAA